MRSIGVLFILGAALLLGRLAASAWACATAFRPDEPVRFADQSVIIWWDAANKVEHFVRRASFQTGSKDFGFIVPTPTQPTLDEAKASAFDALESITARHTAWQLSFEPILGCCVPKMGMRLDRDADSTVRVLDTKRVAGLDAVVLEADDAQALGEWLKQRGYFFRPELEAWLEFYVARKWKITAFKIAADAPAQDAKASPVTTSAVRMSFAAEQPFFPYRVPAETDPQPRLLRIFLVSDARTRGALAGVHPWSGRAVWADRLTRAQSASLADDLGLTQAALPADTWLTTFDDPSFPNPGGGGDVYFDPDAVQTPLHRPPLLRTMWVPADVAALVAAFLLYRVVIWRTRKRATASRVA